MPRRALIVGAGIGGLSAAIALRQAGWDVAVFEQAEALLPMGAGLSIWPNAAKALAHLGCGEALAAACQPLKRVAIAYRDGREIAGIDVAALVPDMPGFTATRTEIQAMLLEVLGEGALHLGHVLESWDEVTDGVTVRFANGRVEPADLLIAADGIRSAIAASVIGDGPYHAGYGGVLALSEAMGASSTSGIEHSAPGERLGVFNVSGGRAYWFYMRNERDPVESRAITLDQVKARTKGWTHAVTAPVEATRPDALIPFSIHAKPAPNRLGRGRIICVGDAAHAMEPNLGQGACQALEDAVALGAAARDREAGDVLAVYEAMRLKRVRTIVALARKGRLLAHGVPAALFPVAATIMRGLSPLVVAQTRSIYTLPDYEGVARSTL